MLTPEQRAEKNRIAKDWLPRYTGSHDEDFEKYVLLTNFSGYLDEFVRHFNTIVRGRDKPMQSATDHESGLTMVNFGIGAPNAALVCDLLSVVQPEAVLFLGKCGGFQDRNRQVCIEDFILPTAAIRGEGTSDHYYPNEVPALPSFAIQKAAAEVVTAHGARYHSGTVYTTNRRLWEHDDIFREYLRQLRCIGIDMETAALFIAAFANHIPHGALLLVSDLPLVQAKTEESDRVVTARCAVEHVRMGIEILDGIKRSGKSVRYLVY